MASNPLNKQYKLTINSNQGSLLTIQNPLTCEFDITRTISADINQGEYKIYNLNQTNRSLIYEDRVLLDRTKRKQLVFDAGFETLGTIDQGGIVEAYSERSGNSIITTIRSIDSLLSTDNDFISISINKGQTKQQVLNRIANITDAKGNIAFKTSNIQISDGSTVLTRGFTMQGDPLSALKREFPEYNIYTDLGKVYIDDGNIPINNFKTVKVLNADTGLLSTPRRQNNLIKIELVFYPNIKLGEIVQIQSSISPDFNGYYRVYGIKHQGVISGAVAGNTKTILDLFIGSNRIGKFTNFI